MPPQMIGDRATDRQGTRRWFVRAAISASALGVLAMHIDRHKLIDEIASLSPVWIIAAAFLAIGQVIAAAQRWHYVNSALDIFVSRIETLRILMFGLLIGQVLPASIGCDATRAWLIFRAGRKLKEAVAGVVLDRAIGLVVLAAIIAGGFPRLLTGWESSEPVAMVGASAAMLLVGAALSILLLPRITHLAERFPAGEKIKSVLDAATAALCAPTTLGLVLLLSVINHGCSIAIMYLLANGLGASFSVAAAIIFVPPILLASALPISIGGWGIREGAAVILLGQAGLTQAQALAVSVTYAATSLLPAMIGGGVWLTGGWKSVDRSPPRA
jgi:glycosyltransferase 2 family protein